MSAATMERRRRGRPPQCPYELAVRIIRLRDQGLSLARIATVLNDDRVPTPEGGTHWHKSHVDRLLHTRYARDIRGELDKRQEVHGKSRNSYESTPQHS